MCNSSAGIMHSYINVFKYASICHRVGPRSSLNLSRKADWMLQSDPIAKSYSLPISTGEWACSFKLLIHTHTHTHELESLLSASGLYRFTYHMLLQTQPLHDHYHYRADSGLVHKHTYPQAPFTLSLYIYTAERI